MLYVLTLTYIFQGHKFEMLISGATVRASEKFFYMTFIDDDIRHRMGSLQNVATGNLVLNLQGRLFKTLISVTVRAGVKCML